MPETIPEWLFLFYLPSCSMYNIHAFLLWLTDILRPLTIILRPWWSKAWLNHERTTLLLSFARRPRASRLLTSWRLEARLTSVYFWNVENFYLQMFTFLCQINHLHGKFSTLSSRLIILMEQKSTWHQSIRKVVVNWSACGHGILEDPSSSPPAATSW